MEDGWEAPQPEAPVTKVRAASEPPTLEISAEEVVLLEDGAPVFDRPMAYISNDMFDAARGHPATVRPPPTEHSVSIVDLFANGRRDLAKRISKTVNREIAFGEDVSLEAIQAVAKVIVNREWLMDPAEMRRTIIDFLRAYEPDTYAKNADVDGWDDETLHDVFLAQLMEAKRPRLADSLSRQRAKARGTEPQRQP